MTKSLPNRIFLLLYFLASVFYCCKNKPEIALSNKDNPDADRILSNYNLLLQEGDHRKAMKYLDSANQKLAYMGTVNLWRIYRDKHTYYLDHERDLAKSGHYVDSMELLLKRSDVAHDSERVHTYFFRGNLLFAEKKYSDAFRYYYEGRQFALKHLDSCRLSEFTSHLAHIKFTQLRYDDAIAYLKIALEESRACNAENSFHNRFVTIQAKYNTIGVAYDRLGKLDSAITYYEKGLAFIKGYQAADQEELAFTERAYGVICGNLGGAFLKQKNFKVAEALLKKSIALNDRIGYEVQDARTAKAKLAELYLQTNRSALGLSLLQKLVHELVNEEHKNNSQTNLLLKCYQLLKEHYEKSGDIALAHLNTNSYYLLKDSIDKVNRSNNSVDMDMAFELNAQRHKASILEKDNEIKTAYLVAFCFLVLGGMVTLLVFWKDRDKSRKHIAKLNSLNYQNQQNLAALEQSQADNNRILRIVAHDLRNPLSGITGVVTLMLEEDGFSEETRAELALIKETGENSLALVSELLQADFTIKDLKMDAIELQELIQYCVELLKQKAETKQQKIITDSFVAVVLINREKIWRVLSNLIGNAIKFSPEGSSIKISMEKANDFIIVAVKDEGIGIPLDMAAHLFEMFTPARREGTAGEQSFGMGLSIAKQIIVAHGGKIWFESTVGEGTVFYFSLPLISLAYQKK